MTERMPLDVLFGNLARPENRLHFYAAAERFLEQHLPV